MNFLDFVTFLKVCLLSLDWPCLVSLGKRGIHMVKEKLVLVFIFDNITPLTRVVGDSRIKLILFVMKSLLYSASFLILFKGSVCFAYLFP